MATRFPTPVALTVSAVNITGAVASIDYSDLSGGLDLTGGVSFGVENKAQGYDYKVYVGADNALVVSYKNPGLKASYAFVDENVAMTLTWPTWGDVMSLNAPIAGVVAETTALSKFERQITKGVDLEVSGGTRANITNGSTNSQIGIKFKGQSTGWNPYVSIDFKVKSQ